MIKSEILELVRPKRQAKGVVSGDIDFNLALYSHFTLDISADITANLLFPLTPAYVIIEVTHTVAGTTITDLPGTTEWDFAWATGAGERTILGGTYDGTEWTWRSEIFPPVEEEGGGGDYDADAEAYFAAAPVTVTGDKDLWDAFVVGTKADGTYSKLKVVYPFLTAVAAADKINAVNPLDTDAAFRYTQAGGMLYNGNGVTFDGTSGVINTYFIPATHFAAGGGGILFYNRTTTPTGYILFTQSGGSFVAMVDTTGGWGNKPTSSLQGEGSRVTPTVDNAVTGLIGVDMNTAVGQRVLRNGVVIGSNGSVIMALSAHSVRFGAYYAGSAGDFSNANLSMIIFHDTLSDAEHLSLYNRVQTLQTGKSRNV